MFFLASVSEVGVVGSNSVRVQSKVSSSSSLTDSAEFLRKYSKYYTKLKPIICFFKLLSFNLIVMPLLQLTHCIPARMIFGQNLNNMIWYFCSYILDVIDL